VRKEDTARLNTHALVARVSELGIKQWWLARKLEVTTRTVNRWMTGKVKRLSRDNLDRMVEVLKTTRDELSSPDEADVFATRAEQTRAASVLVLPETENMFKASQQFSAYEQLLKATLHPDLTLAQLAVMYNQLVIVAAMQYKFREARQFAERVIEYAQRAGDIGHEMSARTSLAVMDAEEGLLGEARKKLELLADMQESVGVVLRHRANIQHNLCNAYRLIGDMKHGVESANYTLAYYSRHGNAEFVSSALNTCGLMARDIGRLPEARELFDRALAVVRQGALPRDEAEFNIYLLEIDSLQGQTEAAAALPPLLAKLKNFTYFADNYFVSAAGILRRAGELAAAEEVVGAGLTSASTRRYERPLLLQELARIAVARGEGAAAQKLLSEANLGFASCGMGKRTADDPAREVGQQFKRSAARYKLEVSELEHSRRKFAGGE
jgi:hypothetical protein